MSIDIVYTTLGIAATNAWLIGDTETNEAVLIDPVDEADALAHMASERGWTIKLILATHAHFDHILASAPLKELTGAPFWLHQDAAAMLPNLPDTGLRFGMGRFPPAAEPDRLLTSQRESIDVGAIHLETLYTPGHAPGHVSFYLPTLKLVFGGDALFAGSIGRTDLPGGSLDVLLHSIIHVLLPLGDDVRLLPGHGEPTLLGAERRTNPYLRGRI